MKENIILLVEDNADDELLTLMAFKQSHLKNTIHVVRDGAEALDYLFAKGAHAGRDPRQMPHLILLDLKLPKIDGLEVLKRIRANEATKLLPVVILTSSREQKDLLLGYGNGANSYVVKPVDIKDFREAVNQLGMYWMVLNEKPG